MRVIESCVKCLYDKQKARVSERKPEQQALYLQDIQNALDHRKENDSAPYMIYVFNQIYKKHFGEEHSYEKEKKRYNDLVLRMESDIEKRIAGDKDPLEKALLYARIGNYIDFGALEHVEEEQFLQLFEDVVMRENDQRTYQSFLEKCSVARQFLLLADNCGEIVLDKLFIRQLKRRFPQLQVKVMVRGGETLNDVTLEDAYYVGIDKEADIVSNGNDVAGTIYEMLSGEAKLALKQADVILAKGQGNYESMTGQGLHAFYSFLCKCDLFTNRFQVPALTGMFVEE